MADTQTVTEAAPLMPERIDVPLPGVEGLVVTHWGMQYWVTTGLPIDGQWGVAHAASDLRVNRAWFRTLHAAVHYAHRLLPLADWTAAEIGPASLDRAAILHAEAHAHEVDATYPAGRVMECGDGLNLVDDTGDTARFMQNAPSVTYEVLTPRYAVKEGTTT